MVLHVANHRVVAVTASQGEVPAAVLAQIVVKAHPPLQQRLQSCKNPINNHTFIHLVVLYNINNVRVNI